MNDLEYKVGDIVIWTSPIVIGQHRLCRILEFDTRWSNVHVESFDQTLQKITQWNVKEEYLSPMPCDAHLICTQGEERWLIGWSRERGGYGLKQADRSAVVYKLGAEILRFKPMPIPEKKVETTEVHVGGPHVAKEVYDDMKRKYEEERDRAVYLEKRGDTLSQHLETVRGANSCNIERGRQLEEEVRTQKGFNSVAIQQIEKLEEQIRSQVLQHEKEANVLNQRIEASLKTVTAYQGEMAEAHNTIEELRETIRVMETASDFADKCKKDKDFQLDLVVAKHQALYDRMVLLEKENGDLRTERANQFERILGLENGISILKTSQEVTDEHWKKDKNQLDLLTAQHQAQHDLMILLKQENVELKHRLAHGPAEPIGSQRVVSGATVDRMIEKHQRHTKNLDMAIKGLEKRLEAVQKKAAAANLEKEMLKSKIKELLK